MSENLLDTLQQHLTPDTIRQISESLGTDPQATGNAISMALPALLSGLTRNASSPEGASSLDRALGAHDGSILDNITGMLGSGGGNGGGIGGGGIGGAILGHILGSRRAPVEQGVGRATGLNAQQVGQLLVMLAPLVMGALGRMKKKQGIDAAQLPNVLQQNASRPELGGLGRVLDSNNDGQIADDIARLGSSVLGGFLKR